MNNLRKISLFLLPALAVVSCDVSQNGPDVELNPTKINLPPTATEVIASANDFGIDLFTRMAGTEDGNLMLSPLSAHVALTMLLNGSDGDTQAQLRDMLGYAPGLSLPDINDIYKSLVGQLLEADKNVELGIANAIFYDTGFPAKEAFLSTMADEFSATVKELNFAQPSSTDIVNQWASDNTRKRIPKVVERLDPQTAMILMNALYFKGEWTQQFDPKDTHPMPFTLEDGSVIQVNMMSGREMESKAYHSTDFTAVELPYGHKNFSFIAVVPYRGLKDFYTSFTGDMWKSITTTLDNSDWTEGNVSLPKFSFQSDKDLSDILENMGMKDAFYADLADLTGISDSRPYVDFVKQNTFIEVNEEGTEAAAVTSVFVVESSLMANRPFIFAIRERTTNTLMFMGSVTNPLK